jgi:hypothetical protein
LAEVLEAAGWQEGGFGFARASATTRLLVTRVVLRREITNEAALSLSFSRPIRGEGRLGAGVDRGPGDAHQVDVKLG